MNVLTGPLGWQQLPLIMELKKSGFKIYGIDDSVNAPCIKHCDFIVPGGFQDLDMTVSFLEEKSVTQELIMLPLISDVAVRYFNSIAVKIGLADQIVDEAFFNKASLNDLLLSHSLSTKKNWWTAKSRQGDWIIKPKEGSGSRGIKFLSFKNNINPSELDGLSDVVIEERLYGEEYSIDGFIWKEEINFLLSRRILFGDKTAKRIYPVSINDSKIKRTLKQFLMAANYSKGIFHIEVIIKGESIEIIDAACRLGGFSVGTEYFRSVTGLDLFKMQIDLVSSSLAHCDELTMLPIVIEMYYQNKHSNFTILQFPVLKGLVEHKYVSINPSFYSCEELSDGSRLGYSLLKFNNFKSLNEFIRKK